MTKKEQNTVTILQEGFSAELAAFALPAFPLPEFPGPEPEPGREAAAAAAEVLESFPRMLLF